MHQNHTNHPNKPKIIINLKKAQTHLSKIQQMLEDDVYCVDIMQQNLAVMGLLRSAHQMLMEDHLNSCFSNAIKSSSDAKKAQMVDEILIVNKLLSK